MKGWACQPSPSVPWRLPWCHFATRSQIVNGRTPMVVVAPKVDVTTRHLPKQVQVCHRWQFGDLHLHPLNPYPRTRAHHYLHVGSSTWTLLCRCFNVMRVDALISFNGRWLSIILFYSCILKLHIITKFVEWLQNDYGVTSEQLWSDRDSRMTMEWLQNDLKMTCDWPGDDEAACWIIRG